MPDKLEKSLNEYTLNRPKKQTQIAGLLGIPKDGNRVVEVPSRNGYVYVRLRNNTNELIQAFNDKVAVVYDLPVIVEWNGHRYIVISKDTERYAPTSFGWGSQSPYLPKHGSQHSFAPELGFGGDVAWIYSRQIMPFATTPSGTNGADAVWIQPHVYRNPADSSWNYIGDSVSPSLIPAKPTGTFGRMVLLYWDLDSSNVGVLTGSYFSESLTGTSNILPYVPTVSNSRHVPLSAVRLVSGTTGILWDNIYDMRQWATTSPAPFDGGFAVQDEGVPIGTGTTFNFVGENVQASISGSIVRVFVTGSTGGGGSSIDTIGFAGLDEGVPIGTGTFLNVVGAGATFTRSGTTFNLDIPGGSQGPAGPPGTFGVMGLDEGVPLGTGTTLNFVGAGVTATLSGTVFNINIPGGGGTGSSQKTLSAHLNMQALNVPAADTALISNIGLSPTFLAGLVGFTQARIFASFGSSAPSSTGTLIHAKYSTDTVNFSEIAQFSDTEGRLFWITSTTSKTQWFNMAPGSQIEDCWIKFFTTGGNGTTDPNIGTVGIEFR